jgi:YVTN family beta-propeller protein
MRRGVTLLAAAALFALTTACGPGEPEVSTIPIDGRPSAVTVAGGRVWVADDENHTVQTIDPATSESVGDPIGVAKNPIALFASRGVVWVAHASGELSKIDAETREVSTQRVSRASFVSVAADTDGNVFATDVRRGVWDVSGERWNALDDGAVRIVASDGRLWVSGTEETVTRVDVETRKTRTFIVGLGPIGLAYDGKDVWVANSDDDSVQVVGQVVGEDGSVPVGVGPVALVALDGALYVANQDGASVSVVDIEDRSVERTIDIGTQPRDIAAGEGSVWVVGTNREVLVRVQP